MKKVIGQGILFFTLITIISFLVNNGFSGNGKANATSFQSNKSHENFGVASSAKYRKLPATNMAGDMGVKRTIKGVLNIDEDEKRLNVGDLRIITNSHTRFKNGNYSTLIDGSQVKVKGFFVNDDLIVASSLEVLSSEAGMKSQDLQTLALLLLLKHKN